MIKDLKNPKVLLSIVGIVLAIVIIAMQFIPCWTFMQKIDDPLEIKATGLTEKEKTASLADFIWFPKYNDGALKEFNKNIDPLDMDAQIGVNDIALSAVFQFVFALAVIIACIAKPKVSVTGLAGVACGIAGLLGFILLAPAFSIAQNLWIINMVLSALMIAFGVIKLLSNKIFKNA